MSAVYENKVTPLIKTCKSKGSVAACKSASTTYAKAIENTIVWRANLTGVDIYNLNASAATIKGADTYLSRPDVLKAIAARSGFKKQGGMEKFTWTVDGTRSPIPDFASLLDANVQVVIAGGTADWVCGYLGTETVALHTPWVLNHTFVWTELESYDLHGVQKGAYRAFENLGMVPVYDGGHAWGFQVPELLLQVFKQTMTRNLTST